MSTTIMAATVVALGVTGMFAVLTLYGAFVVWVLWGWFIVPLGVPQINLAWAIGIALIGGMLQATPPPAQQDDRRTHALGVLLKPVFALVIGWIAKQFM